VLFIGIRNLTGRSTAAGPRPCIEPVFNPQNAMLTQRLNKVSPQGLVSKDQYIVFIPTGAVSDARTSSDHCRWEVCEEIVRRRITDAGADVGCWIECWIIRVQFFYLHPLPAPPSLRMQGSPTTSHEAFFFSGKAAYPGSSLPAQAGAVARLRQILLPLPLCLRQGRKGYGKSIIHTHSSPGLSY
jgi:hypothetical protein